MATAPVSAAPARGKKKAADLGPVPEGWRVTGHPWIGRKVRRGVSTSAAEHDGAGAGAADFVPTRLVDTTVTRWIPADSDGPALWHVVHDEDGDEEDLDEDEVKEGIIDLRLSGNRPQTSIYRGVSWNKAGMKWAVAICDGGKSKHLGCFLSEMDAARAYDAAAKSIHGPEWRSFNFPVTAPATPAAHAPPAPPAPQASRSTQSTPVVATAATAKPSSSRKPKTSRFVGVHRTASNMWKAQFSGSSLGTFENEEDAARAYDVRARRVKGPAWESCNFPAPPAARKPSPPPALPSRQNTRALATVKTSRFRGVQQLPNSEWRVQIWHEGKHVDIGQFEDEEDAAHAYDAAAAEMKGSKTAMNFGANGSPNTITDEAEEADSEDEDSQVGASGGGAVLNPVAVACAAAGLKPAPPGHYYRTSRTSDFGFVLCKKPFRGLDNDGADDDDNDGDDSDGEIERAAGDGDGVSVYTATPPQAAKKQLKKTTGNRSSSSGSGGGSSCSSSKRQRGMNYPCRFPGCGKPHR